MISSIHLFLMLIITMTGSVAALFLKKASGFQGTREIVFSKNLYIGGALYFFSAVVNIYLLRFLDYSVVLPLTSITYIWTLLLSYLFLHEKISSKKIIGVSGIIAGSVLLILK